MTTHSGGFDVIGAIEVKWLAKGGACGFLGQPLENEQKGDNGADENGRTQRFTGGVIAWHPDIGGAYEVHGAILERWRAVGDVRFGFPITDESTPPPVSGAGIFPAPSPGRYNHFRAVHLAGKPDSSIYWHPDLGAHEIFGAIREKWASLGWERSVVGYPAGAEAPVHGGAVQPFQFGFIAWHPSIGAGRDGAHEVHGSIGARWNALGETDFGFPITDESTPPPESGTGFFPVASRGRYNHFRAVHLEGTPDSSIYWHPDLGAHEVYGAIREKWASLGWERSVVGYPTDAEAPAHGGAVQPFQGGVIAWHPSIGPGRDGAHEVHGSIGARWNALGNINFAFPITDELTPPPESVAGIVNVPSRGRYNHFRAVHLPGAPESSIYWHPDVADGAHEVYGAIRGKWASEGWERSKLGYPVSSERGRQGAGRIQDFQTGAIAWVSGSDAWVDWYVRR